MSKNGAKLESLRRRAFKTHSGFMIRTGPRKRTSISSNTAESIRRYMTLTLLFWRQVRTPSEIKSSRLLFNIVTREMRPTAVLDRATETSITGPNRLFLVRRAPSSVRRARIAPQWPATKLVPGCGSFGHLSLTSSTAHHYDSDQSD